MTSKGKILIVDDDPVLLDLLADTLKAIGYQTVAATDGSEALTQLREHDQGTFDILITDIKMPNMSGLTLLKKIRRLYPDLPVLFITGVVSEETMAAASPDGFLAKPFRIARLEEMIENTLAAKYSSHSPESLRRVLINMPENKLRENLAEAMSCSNYMPFAVSDDNEALEELKRGRFDAMITSLNEVTGSDNRLNQLREIYPQLPVLLADSADQAGEYEHCHMQVAAKDHPCDTPR